MRIDKDTQSDAMFTFLPNDAERCHATRLLLMLRSYGIRDTREVSNNEWDLLVERVMEQVLPA